MPSATQQTLAIIKPDAIEKKALGEIIVAVEEAEFTIVGLKMVRLAASRAAEFYQTHKGKPFYVPLVKFMSSGPVVVMVLEAEDAIGRWRQMMGPTDPAQAREGQLRKRFGTDTRHNACHGSDSEESARKEIAFFFAPSELSCAIS